MDEGIVTGILFRWRTIASVSRFQFFIVSFEMNFHFPETVGGMDKQEPFRFRRGGFYEKPQMPKAHPLRSPVNGQPFFPMQERNQPLYINGFLLTQ